jgi:MFS family permease
MNRNSIWFALGNKRFRTLWVVTLISGSAVAAYNTAAVWLMNSLASSPFFLSLIPVVTSLAFFLFTLPAGIVADIISRSKAVVLINLGLAFLCFCLGLTVWLGWINPGLLLFGVLSLGIGFAFNGPAMAAIVPDLVSDDELSSAVTLGGLQLNISSMVGPAAGGLMILSLGSGGVFLVNALCFLMVVLAALQTGETQSNFTARRETFSGAIVEIFQVVRQDSAIRIVVLRNFIFSLFISIGSSLISSSCFAPVPGWRGTSRNPFHEFGSGISLRGCFRRSKTSGKLFFECRNDAFQLATGCLSLSVWTCAPVAPFYHARSDRWDLLGSSRV